MGRLEVLVLAVRERAKKLPVGDAMKVLKRLVKTAVQYREVTMLLMAGVTWSVEAFFPGIYEASNVLPVFLLVGIPVSIFFRMEAATYAKIEAVVWPYQRELSVKRQQLYRRGNFGLVEDKAWNKEVERFLDLVVSPKVKLTSESRRSWTRDFVNKVASTAPVIEGFFDGMSPVEYEHLVARTLRQHGWNADTTALTGDQGVDVRARKSGIKLVVQCKLYSNAVGNAAVQEAIAAREWEGATHAAVVTNAQYTRSAKELAHKAGVLLWHHDELPDAETKCAALPAHIARRPAAASKGA